MPDWRQLVRDRLKPKRLSVADLDSIISELAAHLEEIYDEARARGLTEEQALQIALQEVEDWHVLAAEIDAARFEEGLMNQRTKRLWLPALITLLGASVSLAATQFMGLQPQQVWIGGMGMTFYWPWLATLPIFSAAGAYMSRRAAGQTPMRLAAGLSPALVMLMVMFLVLPWGFFLDGFHFFRLVHFGLGLINWVGIPAAALLVGALPFLRGNNQTAEMNR
jgi:hypothetical protein